MNIFIKLQNYFINISQALSMVLETFIHDL